jgi:hypothetical protein
MSWQCDGCGEANLECFKRGGCAVYTENMLKAVDALGKRAALLGDGRADVSSWPALTPSMLGERLWGRDLVDGRASRTRSAGALLKQMLELGLVQRAGNKRLVYWRLTQKGRNIARYRR